MTTILLILQVFIVLSLVLVILFQRTGADGLSGLSGGGHNIFSSRSTSNAFTKITIILAAAFMINSLALAKIAILEHQKARSVIESINQENDLENKEIKIPLAK